MKLLYNEGWIFEKTECYFGLCTNSFSVIQVTTFLLRIHTVFQMLKICGFVLSFMFLQLYRYTITQNSLCCSDFLCVFVS